MLLQSEFRSIVFWKKNLFMQNLPCICLSQISCWLNFVNFSGCWHIFHTRFSNIYFFSQNLFAYLCTERRRKYIFLISSILTETMRTNSNWLVQNNIQWQNCYKNSNSFVFIHCKVFVFVWQSFQFLSRSKVFACLRRL